jgi:pimeloyl-ACP methyl ester carboxylesterase
VPAARLDDAIIHYETAGEGTPLVLLHGIGSNSQSWNRQLAGLAADFKVIAWDAPGYGRSSDPPVGVQPSMGYYADCLARMLDSLGLHEMFLLGHSLGGVIAQEFYERYPQYVRALILAYTRRVGSDAGLEERLTLIRTMTPAQLAAQRAPKLVSRQASRPLIDEVTHIMSEVRPAGYEFAAIALAKSPTYDVLPRVRVPALLIWGAEDAITPLWDAVPAGIPVKVINGAGHLCYIEKPEEFNNLVREFLSSLSL